MASAKIKWYQEQYALSKQKAYGRSSEQGIAGQLTLDIPLFNEAEALREPINVEPTAEEILPKSAKKIKRERITQHFLLQRIFLSCLQRRRFALNAASRSMRCVMKYM